MRKKEREIKERREIESVIHRSRVCRLAMSEGDCPYVVPLCFGYKDNALYFHTAMKGMKMDILKKNSRVCFEFDLDHEMVTSPNPCDWGIKYRSVIGFGNAVLLEQSEPKKKALQIILEHYGAKGPFSYSEKGFRKTMIIKVGIESVTGKKAGY
ncbi:MAG: pyridoxamine 5'-phosphate oxidase family protein [Deltaproteobacteria bacterium]|jgi:nitroimidazol reductase NimA-like FMN-containing flavoprotein (pyridoxamine 5'-phosphate oxidase superfamily)